MSTTPTSGGGADAAAKEKERDPNLPPLVRVGNLIAPKAPQDIASTGLEERVLADLLVKWGFTETRFFTECVAEKLHLSPTLAHKVLERVCLDGTVEQLWQTGQGLHHYRITPEGRQHAARLLEICGYIGAAPVSLEAYTAMLRWQFANTPHGAGRAGYRRSLGTCLTPKAAQFAGLAVSSGRSLFLFGPARKRQKQHRPQAPRRPAGRLLDPLRHQRGQRRDPPVR